MVLYWALGIGQWAVGNSGKGRQEIAEIREVGGGPALVTDDADADEKWSFHSHSHSHSYDKTYWTNVWEI